MLFKVNKVILLKYILKPTSGFAQELKLIDR